MKRLDIASIITELLYIGHLVRDNLINSIKLVLDMDGETVCQKRERNLPYEGVRCELLHAASGDTTSSGNPE